MYSFKKPFSYQIKFVNTFSLIQWRALPCTHTNTPTLSHTYTEFFFLLYKLLYKN